MVLLGIMLQLQFDILIDSQLCLMEVTGGGGEVAKRAGRKEERRAREGRKERMQGAVCCYFVVHLFRFFSGESHSSVQSMLHSQ